MTAVTSTLAAFSGKGVNMLQDLTHQVKANAAILKPFITTCSDALGNCYPDLYEDEEKFDLIEALESDRLKKQIDQPAVNGSLSTIAQMTHFFLHMKHSGRGIDEAEAEFSAFTGDREGLLSAVAAASSATDAEFGTNAAKAVKAAFYAGLKPDKVAEEWNQKGISFEPVRRPCVAGETGKDLRESEDLTKDLADLVSKNYKVDWKSVADSTASTSVLAFGSERPVLDQFREAVEQCGCTAADWQLEAAGEGGTLWSAIGFTTPELEARLLAELRKLPCGASLPDDLFITHKCPGDLLKALKQADAATATDERTSWQWSDVNWVMVVYFAVTHALALYGLALSWNRPDFYSWWASAFLLYGITGALGITGGAHRLWSHRSYKAHFPARFVMMIANSVANQGSIYHWSRDHRVHHAKSDTEADPHDITRGLFYSHMGWLLLKKRQAVKEAGKQIDCSDLLEDPLVWIQDKCDPWWNQFFCFAVPTLYFWYYYDEALLGFLIMGCGRWLLCLHATWCVNSTAHAFGSRPYTPNMYPTQCLWTTIVAVGEGYHNWHHTYPYDYSASEMGCFRCYNPTTLWIDFLALVGQAYGRKRAIHRKAKTC